MTLFSNMPCMKDRLCHFVSRFFVVIREEWSQINVFFLFIMLIPPKDWLIWKNVKFLKPFLHFFSSWFKGNNIQMVTVFYKCPAPPTWILCIIFSSLYLNVVLISVIWYNGITRVRIVVCDGHPLLFSTNDAVKNSVRFVRQIKRKEDAIFC
jgi:hypothetical protein